MFAVQVCTERVRKDCHRRGDDMTDIFWISRDVVKRSASDIVPNQDRRLDGLMTTSNTLPSDCLALSVVTQQKLVGSLKILSEPRPKPGITLSL